MVDWYSKGILTIIAAALCALVVQQALVPARAASDCGSSRDECYVIISGATLDVPVYVMNHTISVDTR